jgi:O-phosphoseryl-tRNA(Cys) synthetase
LYSVNLVEAVELLDAVSDFNFKETEKKPDFYIYDNQKEGYILYIKARSISEEYRNYLKEICKSRNLRIRESEEYPLIIYGNEP